MRSRPLSAVDTAAVLGRLDQIDLEISTGKFSIDFADRVYTLRQHVDFVRRQLSGATTSSKAV